MRREKCILLLFLLAISWPVLAQNVIRGPYLQSAGANSIILKWRTNQPTASKVWMGATPASLTSEYTDSELTTEHEVLVPGLTPSTKYYYAVGHPAGQLVGADQNHYYISSPEVGEEKPMKIWVMGDGGTANDNARNVRDGYYDYIGDQETDMILMLGDNAYYSGTDAEYQPAVFENMYEDMLIHSPLWSCPGNHEYQSANSATKTGPYYDIFTFPTNGEIGGLPSGSEAYYSFDYGNVHIISLDSQGPGIDVGDPMLVWLENDLNATNQDWIIVIFHHPAYSKGSHDSDNEYGLQKVRENFIPILDAGGVDLVLSGHSHSYERSYLINGHYGPSNTFTPEMLVDGGDGRTDGNGAYRKLTEGVEVNKGSVYVVAGNAGKSANGPFNHPAMFYNSGELGSLSLELEADQLDLKFINIGGEVLDYFTMRKVGLADGSPPTISLNYENDTEDYFINNNISFTANAQDVDNDLVKVEFYLNGAYVDTDYEAPYQYNFSSTAAGEFALTAKATDGQGNSTTSNASSITIQDQVIDPTPGEGITMVYFPASIILSSATADMTTISWEEPVFTTDCMVEIPTNDPVSGDCETAELAQTTAWGSFNNSNYFYYAMPSTWQEAKAFSNSVGGTLVVIETAEENQFLQTAMPASTAWIGFTDEVVGGQFAWVDGQPVNYTNWGDWRPQVYSGTARFVQLVKGDGKWYDKFNGYRQPFIIEMSCESDNTSGTGGGSGGETALIPSTITVNQTSPIPNGGLFPSGVSTVNYQVSDDCGNTMVSSFTITIAEPPVPGDDDTDCSESAPQITGFTWIADSPTANYYVSDNQYRWGDGQELCQSLGGYLASIGSAEENELILSGLTGINDFLLIGLSDQATEGQLTWADNSAYTFANVDPNTANSADFDFGLINPWTGFWKLESTWIRKRVIMEVPCTATEATLSQPLTSKSIKSPRQESKLLVFPNPVDDQLHLEYKHRGSYKEAKLSVMDPYGNIIMSEDKNLDLNIQQWQVDTRQWQDGMYMVHLHIGAHRITQRFVKMNKK